MHIENYRGFEIYTDPEFFDMFSFRRLEGEIGEYRLNGVHNKKPFFTTLTKTCSYIDGWIDGYNERTNIIKIIQWKDDKEDFASKILKPEEPE